MDQSGILPRRVSVYHHAIYIVPPRAAALVSGALESLTTGTLDQRQHSSRPLSANASPHTAVYPGIVFGAVIRDYVNLAATGLKREYHACQRRNKQGIIFAMHTHPTLSRDVTSTERQYRAFAGGSELVLTTTLHRRSKSCGSVPCR